MALIVEDGSIVDGANSYVTLAEIRAYCEARGLELPEEDAGVEVMAVQAFDYLEAMNGWKGCPVQPNQRTAWPRDGVVIGTYQLPSTEIPWQLKEAQCQATYEATVTDLMPNPTAAIKREKVDVLETEYQDGASSTYGETSFPKVDAKIKCLLDSGLGRIRVRRA